MKSLPFERFSMAVSENWVLVLLHKQDLHFIKGGPLVLFFSLIALVANEDTYYALNSTLNVASNNTLLFLTWSPRYIC